MASQMGQICKDCDQRLVSRRYKMVVFGYRFNNFTYITDANYIGPAEMEKIKGSEVLVINALRKEKHISHFNLEEALAIALEVGANTTYLTHLSHQMGIHEQVQMELPTNVFLAFDGLRFEL